MTIDDILKYIKKWNCNLVEVTGGEPLFQKECINLLNALINKSYEVLLETGGSLPIGNVPKNVIKIIDFKCPSSGMEKKNLWSIVKDLQVHDEIKFVIGNKEDFEWSKNIINKYSLNDICTLFFSPVYGKLKPAQLVDWILNDNINVRMQLQMHKSIWPADKKGV
jgi:7-carboxy-7-deazaguanine synthase